MASVRTREVLQLDGRRIELSNTGKVLFPQAGLTKGDLIDYYRRVAPVMLRQIEGRPLSLQRFPDGVEGGGFMQKNASDYFPPWIRRAHLAKEGGTVDYVLAGDAATLAYLANQAAITIHTGLARVDQIDRPDRLVIDLDPSDDDFSKVKRGAKAVRELIEALGLVPFVQTTGSRGLHVWVPLDRSENFDEVRRFAAELADRLFAGAPGAFTTAQRKAGRGARLFLDVARNAYGQTAVAPYSVRARPEAPVATPLEWRELDDASLRPRRYTIANLFRRLGQKPDPWAEIDRHARPLRPAAEKLAAMAG
jgi:bifunctional non-homologous end joining protein LigD